MDNRKYRGTKFINVQFPGCPKETVDEFTNWKEARKMILEYRQAYGYTARLWISQRPCGDWWE